MKSNLICEIDIIKYNKIASLYGKSMSYKEAFLTLNI